MLQIHLQASFCADHTGNWVKISQSQRDQSNELSAPVKKKKKPKLHKKTTLSFPVTQRSPDRTQGFNLLLLIICTSYKK